MTPSVAKRNWFKIVSVLLNQRSQIPEPLVKKGFFLRTDALEESLLEHNMQLGLGICSMLNGCFASENGKETS